MMRAGRMPLHRRTFRVMQRLRPALALRLTACTTSSPLLRSAHATPPNIVVLLADDLGIGELGGGATRHRDPEH